MLIENYNIQIHNYNILIKILSKYGVANPEDLWSALQDAFDESAMPQNKFKIQEVMDTWIRQKGYPLVTVIRDQYKKIKITQEYFRPYEKMRARNNSTANINQKWWIPINFASRTNPDFSATLATHWLSPEVEELIIEDINPQDWIIVNIQQTGKRILFKNLFAVTTNTYINYMFIYYY